MLRFAQDLMRRMHKPEIPHKISGNIILKAKDVMAATIIAICATLVLVIIISGNAWKASETLMLLFAIILVAYLRFCNPRRR